MNSPKINRLLVPVDFSPGSQAALEYAAYFARAFGGHMDVLHVWEMPQVLANDVLLQMPAATDEPIIDHVRQQAEAELEAFLARCPLERNVSVGSRLATGDVDSVILQLAEQENYDLIVMGTHGRTGLAHLLMGSIAEKVVRQAPCPVLTVRAPPLERARVTPAALPHPDILV